ncbi:MAG: MBL fold metallo-hydrolase [Pseudomonadales bacterium]|nr:MBL fold metallo-hydrolase [Pseudomonadales bacterium]
MESRINIRNIMFRFFSGMIVVGMMVVIVIVIVLLASWVWHSEAGQNWLLERAVTAAIKRPSTMASYDGLKVFLCGTSSPLPGPGRAQACVAILAGESVYLVDAGAGSAQVAALGRLPLARLEAVFLTHFHSDHIAALPEFNLNSWVAGRQQPLAVYGPVGVAEVVAGLNSAYRLDLTYRVAHHGAQLLPPGLGVMEARLMAAGSVLEMGDLTISSFLVNHDPVQPAVGYRFDYRGRSVVISGDATITPALIEAATGADLLLQDTLSLPIIKSLERASAGSRMAKIFFDIRDYHAHTSDLAALVEQSGVAQLALYHLIPPPQNALLVKVFMRDVPQGTVLTEDGMIFELPAASADILIVDP